MITNRSAADKTTENFKLYGIDFFSACISAVAVAPFIAIIDQAVTEKTADKSISLITSATNNLKTLVFRPAHFLTRPTFLFVCIVYGATYIAANTITTFCEVNNTDSYWPKMLGTTVVNMGFGIAKDRYFAKVFNKGAPPVFPLISWGLFFGRDLLTIGAGFNFPKAVSNFLQDKQIIKDSNTANTVTQLGVPMLAQMFLTPIHVLALDIYNRAGESSRSRFQYIKGIYPETVSIRMARVLCAYGIAGITNKNVKSILRKQFIGDKAL
mmetsp:Transcript_9504/g.10021  ORF Transcript_9504/g.10021 Transcript_9504/m.10021 type:complete len:268 (+) Transcript_9504:32-835(+)